MMTRNHRLEKRFAIQFTKHLVIPLVLVLNVMPAYAAVAVTYADITLPDPRENIRHAPAVSSTTETLAASQASDEHLLYQVSPLSAEVVAALSHARAHAHDFGVVDSEGRAMPTYHLTDVLQQQEQVTPATLYNWEDDAEVARLQTSTTEIDVKTTHADVTVKQSFDDGLGDKPHDESGISSPPANASSSTWLMVYPKLSHRSNPQSTDKVRLSWKESDQKVRVTVSASDDLVNWQSYGADVLVNKNPSPSTSNASEAFIPETSLSSSPSWIKNHITSVSSRYRYWRFELSSPLTLQQAHVVRQARMRSVMKTHVTLTPTSQDKPSWQVAFDRPVALDAMSFDVPASQLWQMTLSKAVKTKQQHKPKWQQLATGTVSNLANADMSRALSEHGLPKPGTSVLSLARLQTARKLQLTGSMPVRDISAYIHYPKQQLNFIAQGTPPYRLVIFQADAPVAMVTGKSLPDALAHVAPRPATMAALQDTEDTAWVTGMSSDEQSWLNGVGSGGYQWLLWLVMSAVVMALLWMAWHVVTQIADGNVDNADNDGNDDGTDS